MSNEIAKNVPNFIPMGQAAGERVKKDETGEIDAEGRPVNPHIPQFIAKAPWYLDSGAKSSLKHQRLPESSTHHIDKPLRGERRANAATKYRKGACENCGASSHKTKDCLERPRKIGARWNNCDIQADEVLLATETSWDSKRDIANGYDFDNHAKTLEQTLKFADDGYLKTETQSIAGASIDLVPQSIAEQTKSSSNSHMRLREDTASYLQKDRADETYDPKTRTMKRTAQQGPNAEAEFIRGSNDAATFQAEHALAWSSDVSAESRELMRTHAQAAPSQAAIAYREGKRAKIALQQDILQKYGDSSAALPSHLLDGAELENELDVASQSGSKTTGLPQSALTNGHTTVWGSWYEIDSGNWGYKCCKSVLKNAYCII